MSKQVYNRVLLFNFLAATVPQQQFAVINVPFRVGKVVVQPITRYISNPNHQADFYVLQCPDINPEATGVIGNFCGDDTTAPMNDVMTFVYNGGKTFNGQSQFFLRSFTEALGGVETPITARVLVMIEFHEL